MAQEYAWSCIVITRSCCARTHTATLKRARRTAVLTLKSRVQRRAMQKVDSFRPFINDELSQRGGVRRRRVLVVKQIHVAYTQQHQQHTTLVSPMFF